MSLLAGLLGGAAGAVYDIADDKIKREGALADRKELAEHQAELEAKKLEALEILKERREEALQQRVAGEYTRAEQGAEAIATERDKGGMLRYSKGLENQGPMTGQFTPEDLEAIRNMPPEARKIYEEAGILKRETPLTRIDDMQTAAGKIGAHSSVLKALQERRTAVVAELKEEYRRAVDQAKLDQTERRLTETERSNREREENADRRTDALIARAERSGSGSAPKPGDMTDVQKARSKEFDDQINGLEAELKEMRKAKVYGKAKIEAHNNEIAAMQSKVEAARSAKAKFLDSIDAGGKPSAPATPAKPASAVNQNGGQSTVGATMKSLPPGARVIGTSGGKRVYEVGGKKYIEQ